MGEKQRVVGHLSQAAIVNFMNFQKASKFRTETLEKRA